MKEMPQKNRNPRSRGLSLGPLFLDADPTFMSAAPPCGDLGDDAVKMFVCAGNQVRFD